MGRFLGWCCAAAALAVAGTAASAAPAHADRIVAVRPKSVAIGDRVGVRAENRIAADNFRIDFSRRHEGRVRVRGTRVKPRLVSVQIPDRVTRLLRDVDGAPVPTRLRLRLVIDGTPGPWTGPGRRLLVGPRTASGDDPGAGDGQGPGGGPAPGGSGQPSGSEPAGGGRLLAADDFTYAGSFAMPDSACGWPTAWSTTGLALRRVDGRLQFFGGVHVYSGGLLYETDFPGLGNNPSAWPQARVVGDWCDVYQGHKRTGDGHEALNGDNQTEGLLFDATDQRLYWSFGEFYNGDASNDNVLGYTTLGTFPAAHGPWRTTGGVHSQKVRGGALLIPRWFADAYLGGRRLGIGFGGYYCIIGQGSMGPTLFAVAPPDDATAALEPLVLMDHPAPVSQAESWSVRPPDYSIDPGIDWAVDPVDGVGRWAPGDTVSGAAVWIDEPDVQGLVVATQLQLGRIWYGGGALHSDGDASHWYIYDPAVLADVAQGKRSPESVQPAQIAPRTYPVTDRWSTGDFTMTQRIAGMAYDSPTRTLFLLQLNARSTGGDFSPVVHAYRLSGG